MSPPRILISAAEASGDRLAAELLLALRARFGEVQARGLAGPRMRELGVEVVARAEEVNVMGVAEVLRHLPRIRRARAAMQAAVDQAAGDPAAGDQAAGDQGADALVVVDAPDLHLPLAARAKARGIPVIGIVSPQVWAWRRSRVHRIAASMDRLCCLFSFEPAVYADVQAGGFRAIWTGHPVVDRLPRRDPAAVDPDLWALLPGSRAQELRRHLGPFLEAAALLRQQRQGARFLLASPAPPPGLPDWVRVVPSVQELSACRGALTKSGTVTLELAVLGLPMVVAHRVHPLTYALGRLLVRQVHHVALPNVLADQAAGRKVTAVVPEHLQHLHPQALAQELLALPQVQPVDLSPLGPPGAAERAAAVVAEVLGLPQTG